MSTLTLLLSWLILSIATGLVADLFGYEWDIAILCVITSIIFSPLVVIVILLATKRT